MPTRPIRRRLDGTPHARSVGRMALMDGRVLSIQALASDEPGVWCWDAALIYPRPEGSHARRDTVVPVASGRALGRDAAMEAAADAAEAATVLH
jgi:hypothetical protein